MRREIFAAGLRLCQTEQKTGIGRVDALQYGAIKLGGVGVVAQADAFLGQRATIIRCVGDLQLLRR